jgi:protein SCO1/2
MNRRLLALPFIIIGLVALSLSGLLLLRQSLQSEDETESEGGLTSQVPAEAEFEADENPYGLQIAPLTPLDINDMAIPSTTGQDFVVGGPSSKITLIYFGYMTCPDFCPTTMADLSRVMREMGARADEVNVVMVTVDPERDTLELLTRYVAAFDERFIGLRAQPDLLQPLINQFGVVAARREVDSAVGYLVDHTVSVFLMDKQGRLIGRLPYGTPYQEIVAELNRLLDSGAGL